MGVARIPPDFRAGNRLEVLTGGQASRGRSSSRVDRYMVLGAANPRDNARGPP